MSTTTHRREFDCPVEGRIVLDEACCPVCTKPFEPCDGATHTRHGYGWPPEDCRVLSICEQCPTDERDRTRAFEVTWTDELRREGWGEWFTHRAETWRHLGWFDAGGELHLDDDPERDAFRAAFPDLSSTEVETMRTKEPWTTIERLAYEKEELRRERDELLAALEKIAAVDPAPGTIDYGMQRHLVAVARAALAKGES